MPCSVQPQLAQPATVIQVQAQRGPSTTRGRDQHAEGPSLPAAGLAELCGRSDGQCRLQRSSSALPPSVFSCEPSAPLQQRVCSARCTVAEMKSSLSLRRGKTTAASGQEEKETEMDKEPFGGGLAAEDDQVTLEPWSKVSAGGAFDGTQSWKGPSTRSAAGGGATRARAMSADSVETPRTRRVRLTTAELERANEREKLANERNTQLQEQLQASEEKDKTRETLERASSISSGLSLEKASPAGERVVESTINPADLAATWEDTQRGVTDWRASPVSGEKTSSEGASGKVLRAVWKSSIAVAVKECAYPRNTTSLAVPGSPFFWVHF